MALKIMGLSPVAAIKYRKGLPAFAPKTLGELILGKGDDLGVNRYLTPSFGIFFG
jgi:hypothetical protein